MDENEVRVTIDAAIQPLKEIMETMKSELAGLKQTAGDPDPTKKDPDEPKVDPFLAWATDEKGE